MGKTEKLHDGDSGDEVDQGINDGDVQELWAICQKAEDRNE